MEKLTFSSQPDAADPDKKHNRFDKSWGHGSDKKIVQIDNIDLAKK
jgi:hypothetical protein